MRSASLDCEALPLTEFTHKYQAQVALLGIQFMWTLDCEDSLYRAKTEKGAPHADLALAPRPRPSPTPSSSPRPSASPSPSPSP